MLVLMLDDVELMMYNALYVFCLCEQVSSGSIIILIDFCRRIVLPSHCLEYWLYIPWQLFFTKSMSLC